MLPQTAAVPSQCGFQAQLPGVLPPLLKKNVFSQETGDLTYRRSLYSKLQA